MAYTTIKKPSDYFNTKLYSGNGSTQDITGVGFQPDLVWLKERSQTESHVLIDAVRGVLKRIRSNTTDAEDTVANSLTTFGTDGFSLGSAGEVNENSQTYASWNWKANGAGSANTDGSISSTVSANTTSGFSIVSYTGNGTGGATIGHGLGVAPKIVIIKRRNSVDSWIVWLVDTTQYRLALNLTNASDTAYPISTSSTIITTPSTVDSHWNGSGSTYISYCFAEKQGYSKFGSYTGNGSTTDGTFVYLGFKPAFVMVKCTSASDNWNIHDSVRNEFNLTDNILYPNLSNAEGNPSVLSMDLLSQGFKLKGNDGGTNGSGRTYIYMAFAEEPLVGDNPATAR